MNEQQNDISLSASLERASDRKTIKNLLKQVACPLFLAENSGYLGVI